MRTAILGLGHYLPPEVEMVGARRPIAVEAIGPSTLAARASGAALERAGMKAEDVDFIVFATMTPDVTFPGAGCFFQEQLGCGTVGALDIRAQCAGFIFGLVIADQFLQAGVYRNVLLAGAEVHSSGLDYSERGARVAALYGDGAGIAILGPGTGNRGLQAAAIHTDGRQHRQFWCEYPASRQHPVRMTTENFHAGKHFPSIDFDAVQRFGEENLPTVIDEALQKTAAKRDDIKRYIVAHVLPAVALSAATRLGVSARLNVAAQTHGHLSAAALPVALNEEIAAGNLQAGDTVCLAACGAGFAWGAAILTL